jgi:endoglucanase
MFDRRTFLKLGSAAVANAGLCTPSMAASVQHPGVNLAGGEFGTGDRLYYDYIYPSEKQIAYYASRGMKLIRVPVKSRRLIPNGKPNPTDIGILKSVISWAHAKRMTVVLDVHEYALKADGTPWLAGEPDLMTFHEMWKLIASQFRDASNLWFGLMNEPNKQSPADWFKIANAGIAGIRQSTTKQYITVMGSRWGTADGWVSTGNASASEALRDTANKLIIEMHQYLDNAGGKPELAGPVPGKGAKALEEATKWARARRKKLFLGEWGVTADLAYLEEGRQLLRHMYSNTDVWMGYAYWSGGLWWAEGRSTYGFSLEPASLDTPKDRAQMLLLREFLK